MKKAHYIEMRVFVKEDDNEELIMNKIKKLFPYEKLNLKSKISYGFEDNKIKVVTVNVNKINQTNSVLKSIFGNLNDEQKQLLLKQIESRLDDILHFYLRLDKDKLLKDEYWLTDTGNCFHFKIAVAAYPHKKEIAKEIMKIVALNIRSYL